MYLTEQIQLKKTDELSKICHLAKNLYNSANWLVRKRYFFVLKPKHFNNRWFRKQKIKLLKKHRKDFHSLFEYSNDLKKIKENYISKLNDPNGRQGYYGDVKLLSYTKLWNLLKFERNYRDLPIQSSQQILKLVVKNWKSYFRGNKRFKTHPHEFHFKKPKIPGYKKKNGESIAIFTNQQCKIKDGCLRFPEKSNLVPIKTRIKEELKEVRVIPKGICYIIEIVYEKEEKDLGLNKNIISSIDLGLNRIISVVNNNGYKPFIVKGNNVKSINQFYNKQLAHYEGVAKKINNLNSTKRIERLHLKRNNKIKDIFHKISRKMINYCIKNDIGVIVVGKNDGWKQNINIGKMNNQNFVQVPFNQLLKQIEYKAKLVGIDFSTINESYTSKCSFLDNEEIRKHDKYLGKRISRDLFRTSDGRIIDADVNGAYNIMKKAFPKAFCNGTEALGLKPQIITII